ncbi:AAA family ATPase [Micromonospora sp. WMMD1082]|uniref:AAA family ATPase n=1 Tax=Micromonospora sp. WMMD1082 TaxID=3016104 RepID=UPI002415A55B|nr:AAA family ATPase [Micromonospora sp. WMMD1082]MDG4796499.1 adenylyl-sulfate kinase [Micromonospora sp. WMMD1082]
MPELVILTGPIAAGKNTVADRLTQRLTERGRTVVVADVDDVAAMVGSPGAGRAGLWFAAHEAHGALVGQWMRSHVDYVVAVGPFWTVEERAALTRALPDGVAPRWIVIDAPVTVTLPRARADPGRGLSRDPAFHQRAHDRFRRLLPTIPAEVTFDSQHLDADEIAAAIAETLGAAGGGRGVVSEQAPPSPTG